MWNRFIPAALPCPVVEERREQLVDHLAALLGAVVLLLIVNCVYVGDHDVPQACLLSAACTVAPRTTAAGSATQKLRKIWAARHHAGDLRGAATK